MRIPRNPTGHGDSALHSPIADSTMATFLDNAHEKRETASWIAGACSVAAQRTVKAVAAAPPRDAGPRDAVRRDAARRAAAQLAAAQLAAARRAAVQWAAV